MRFQDRVAVITAAASGIGRATADIIAREGGIVVAVDNHAERLDATVAALGRNGGRAYGKLCDALDAGQVEATVAAIASERGAIDILVNAVGGSTIVDKPGAAVEELSFADWQKLIDFNLSGTFLFTLMHSDTLRIQLYVPQDEAFGVAPGVAAVVRVPEMPGREFPGTVTRIADALQPGTRTLLTEIDVPNPAHALSPGVYCTVELKIPRKTPSLIVPSEAIIFNRDGLSVAVVQEGIAHLHSVTPVRDFGTTLEVSTGVKEGDEVILNPPVDLTDGRKVTVRPHPRPQMS